MTPNRPLNFLMKTTLNPQIWIIRGALEMLVIGPLDESVGTRRYHPAFQAIACRPRGPRLTRAAQ